MHNLAKVTSYQSLALQLFHINVTSYKLPRQSSKIDMLMAVLMSAQPMSSAKRDLYFLITNPALLKARSGEALVA